MKIRVFSTNERGKIEFTKDELEKLLNEVYSEGYNRYVSITTPSNPSWTTFPYCNTIDSSKITLNNGTSKITITDEPSTVTNTTNKIN